MNQLAQYYNTQTDSFLNHFSKTQKRFEVEDIHQMRVAVKRIRAVLRLLEFISGGKFNKKDHFILFRKLFKSSGKLREMQVSLSLVNSLDQSLLYEFKEYLHHRQLKAIPKLNRRLAGFDSFELNEINNSLYEYIDGLSLDVILERSRGYISEKIHKIKLLLKDPNDKNLHRVRFHTKELKEIHRIINSINPQEKSLIFENTLKEFNQQIGDWHDKVILIELLVKFIDRKTDLKKVNHLIDLMERIRKDSLEYRKIVLHELEQLFPGIN